MESEKNIISSPLLKFGLFGGVLVCLRRGLSLIFMPDIKLDGIVVESSIEGGGGGAGPSQDKHYDTFKDAWKF